MAEQRKAFVFALPYDTRLDMIQQFLRIYNGYLDSKGRSLITERTINLLSLDNWIIGFAIVALLYMILFAIIIFNKNKISEAIVNEIISVLTAIEDKKKESDNEQTTDTAGETDF
jgi:hypothetical protein